MTKIQIEDLELACDEFAMLEYWRSEMRPAVMKLLANMCPHPKALRWLTAEVVNHVGKWPGPAELRGLLCTRYDPADGIDQWCSLPGYTAHDAEAKSLADHEQRKIHKNIGGYVDEPREMIRQLTAGMKAIGGK